MLNQAQKTAIRNHVEADPSLLSMWQEGNPWGVADGLDILATPIFTVWRTRVGKHQITDEVSREGTTFTWAGNGFIGRSAGELQCWAELFNSVLACNPALSNVRQAFQDIFSGTGNAANNRTHILACSKRDATRVEKLLAIGTGTLAAPANLTLEGKLSAQDVADAMQEG